MTEPGKGLTKEQLLAIWLEQEPSARSPYALYGKPPMWETLKDGDLTLFTRPGRTQTKDSEWGPYYETDGIHYQWQRHGAWVGQGCQTTFDHFQANGPAKIDIPEIKQTDLKPDDEYNRDFAARRSDFCLRKSIEMYESGPMTDGQRALYEAMKREVSSRAMDKARYSGGTGDLTDLQASVLAQLRADNRPFIAAATEQHWRRGESYYIDSRVSVSKRLRAQFNKANPEQRQ
jgi:hypothetical protein